MNVIPLDQLSREKFAALVKTKFGVWLDAQNSLVLELVDVTESRATVTGGAKSVTYENFALMFLGPADRLLVQGNYWFESPALGRFHLFIVPVSCDATGCKYQAIFNRLVPTP